MSATTSNLEHPIAAVLERRHSPRLFSDAAVKTGVIRSLFEAARWAPSSFNEQPWRYLVATHEQTRDFQAVVDCLVPTNQAWAKEAAVLALAFAHRFFARNGKENRHAWHDVGQATAQLVVEATDRGLVAHQMAGIDREKIRATFAVPEEFDVVAALALGHPSDDEEQSTRSRRPQREFVYSGSWNCPL